MTFDPNLITYKTIQKKTNFTTFVSFNEVVSLIVLRDPNSELRNQN